MATPNIVPRSDSEGGLGTAAKYWASAYIDTITTTGHINLPDNAHAIFGTGSDFRIQHNGTNTELTNSTGNLTFIQHQDNGDMIFQCDNGAGGLAAYFSLDGSLAAHDGSATTALFTKWGDNSKIVVGSGADGRFFHDGTNTYLENTNGDLVIQNKADDKGIIFQSDDGNGGVANYFRLDGGNLNIRFEKNLFLLDDVKLLIGGGTDLQIYHDGSNSYIDETGTGSLYNRTSLFIVQNAAGTKNAIVGNPGADVKLYYNNVVKLETLSTGVAITGDAGATTFNGIPFFTDATNGSMYTHDVSATDNNAHENTAYGFAAMDAITTGDKNVAIGFQAGSAINTGSDNTILGAYAGDAITTGTANIAIGRSALGAEDTHSGNIAIGFQALTVQNAGADAYNIAIGYQAGLNVSTGTQNTLIGGNAGDSITTGFGNVAIGAFALQTEDAHGANVAIGRSALNALNAGADAYNVAVGHQAGLNVTTGVQNTLIGGLAGDALTSGTENVAVGYAALSAEDAHGQNVAVGHNALASLNAGANALNTAVGYFAGLNVSTGTHNTAVGAKSQLNASTGEFNTSLGSLSIGSGVTTGDHNVALGYEAGKAITSGQRNVLIGANAGDALTTGESNVGIGHGALSTEDANGSTTAVGYKALNVQNAGAESYNVAVGFEAGKAVTTGVSNTLIGATAGDALTTGANNVALGVGALGGTTTAANNVAIGVSALNANVLGASSIAIGLQSLAQQAPSGAGVMHNVCVGQKTGFAVTTGVQNTLIGGLAGDAIDTGDNNIIIGYNAAASAVGVDNTTVIGTATTTNAVVHGLRTPLTNAAGNVAAARINNIHVFSDADGAIVTLPDSGDGSLVGASFEFAVTTAATSNLHKIVCTDTTNEVILGALVMVDTDTSDAIVGMAAETDDSFSAVSFNGTTTGGRIGTKVKITNIAADKWFVEGTVLHSGNVATPFATS